MGFFSRKSLQKKNDEDRARIIDDLKDALKVPQMTRVYHAILELTQDRHIGNPEVPFVINGAIESIAQRDLEQGIRLALYALGNLHRREHNSLGELLVDKAFSLIGRADRTNMTQMAGVAMLAHVISEEHAGDSETGRRAQKEWKSAFDTLAADKKQGIQYAFAAASNVAIGKSWSNPLRSKAIDAWSEAVAELAQTDMAAAHKEAERVAHGYDSFGDEALPFRSIAYGALKKLSR